MINRLTGLLLCILSVLVLLACAVEEEVNLQVLMPEGSTALSHAWMEYSQTERYKVSRVSGPSLLVAGFTSETYDVIIAPVTMGAKMMASGSPYQMGAVITWGNLYIASQQPITSLDDLNNQTIFAFGETQIPDFVLTHLLQDTHFDRAPEIQFLGSAQEAALKLTREEDAIVLTSEPFLSLDALNQATLHIIDLGELWGNKHAGLPFPQAGLFLHNRVVMQDIEQYLMDLEISIEWVNHTEYREDIINELEYPISTETAILSIPRSGIILIKAKDIIDELTDFFTMIYEFDVTLIGSVPMNTDYYQGGD